MGLGIDVAGVAPNIQSRTGLYSAPDDQEFFVAVVVVVVTSRQAWCM